MDRMCEFCHKSGDNDQIRSIRCRFGGGRWRKLYSCYECSPPAPEREVMLEDEYIMIRKDVFGKVLHDIVILLHLANYTSFILLGRMTTCLSGITRSSLMREVARLKRRVSALRRVIESMKDLSNKR